jgi:hypothetical protein
MKTSDVSTTVANSYKLDMCTHQRTCFLSGSLYALTVPTRNLDIHHTFQDTPAPPSKGGLITIIQKTLLAGWTVYQTLEGRILFDNEEADSTTWYHPDPNFDETSHNDLDLGPSIAALIPPFEALSYVWSETLF